MLTEEAARHIVKLRAGGVCEAAIPNVCSGSHDTTHHRLKRRHAAERWAPSNLLGVCGSGTTGCHGWIEAHPTFAKEEGYWLEPHQDPREVSVHMRWSQTSTRSWWFLDDEGMLTWDESDIEPVVLMREVAELLSPMQHTTSPGITHMGHGRPRA